MTPCQPTIALCQLQKQTAEIRYLQTVPKPTRDDLALFTGADRDLLARLLRESVEYVDNPVFHKPGAEKRLFGTRAMLAGNGTHFMEAPSCHRNAKDRLSAAEEILEY